MSQLHTSLKCYGQHWWYSLRRYDSKGSLNKNIISIREWKLYGRRIRRFLSAFRELFRRTKTEYKKNRQQTRRKLQSGKNFLKQDIFFWEKNCFFEFLLFQHQWSALYPQYSVGDKKNKFLLKQYCSERLWRPTVNCSIIHLFINVVLDILAYKPCDLNRLLI